MTQSELVPLLEGRIAKLETELQELRKTLAEAMPRLTVEDLHVTGAATLDRTLSATVIQEDGQPLGEKYQVKGEGVNAPSLTISGNATVTDAIAAKAIKEDGKALSDKYQPKGDYLSSPGGVVKGPLRLDISHRTGSAGRDILYLKGDPNQNDAVIILQSSDQLTIWDHRPGRDQIGFLKVGGVRQPSDARLKHRVLRLQGVLNRLEAVRGVSFEWNELYDPTGGSVGHKQVGVIAQEVEAAFPELVHDEGNQDFKTLEYSRLVPILVEAVKELRQEKDRQLAALSSQVDALERRLQLEQPFVLRKEVGYDTANA